MRDGAWELRLFRRDSQHVAHHETTEADKGHTLSLPSCRFQVVANKGGTSCSIMWKEGGGGVGELYESLRG